MMSQMIQTRFPALLHLCAATFTFAMLAASAGAQKLPTATAPGASITVGGTYSAFQAQYPQRVLGGAGAYVDLNLRHSLGLEGEVHFLRQNQIAGSYQTTYLVGPRVELHYGRFSPYAKAFIGDGYLKFPLQNGFDTGYGYYFVFGGGGGLDYQLTERIKIRAVDFEYQYWPYVNTENILSIAPYGLSAGISYRVAHTGGWRHHHYR